jgi:hypothetical protein
MAAPAQFQCGAVRTRRLEAIDDIPLGACAAAREIGLPGVSPRLLLLVGERLAGQVLGAHPPTATPMCVPQIVSADQRGVFGRLIHREMRHQPAIAECERVAVHHKHTTVPATPGNHLPSAAGRVGVATKWIEPAPPRDGAS